MTTRRPTPLLGCLLLLVLPTLARGDAIVRSEAMNASTIAEYFVEKGRVRVDLEIGVGDLQAFRNLLPDELYEKLGDGPRPLAERIEEFFRETLRISADGAALPGRIVEIGPRPRVRRDAVSGESLPAAADAEDEIVIFARLEYELSGTPEQLVLRGLRANAPVGVGFVAYHGAVAVNDFRYLTAAQVLELDWDDPWYSRFEGRGLRRQYFAPMSGFLYVEPYEVRKEIVARPLDLQRWVDLGLEGRETIPVEMQADLKRKVAEFLREHHRVEIDGRAVEGELARVNFLERTLRTSRVIDPPEELDVHAAMLGVIFVYPIDSLPDRVTMDWDLWDAKITQVPGSSVDQAGPLPVLLEPDFRVIDWQNFLKNPEIPALTVIAAPPGALARAMRWGRWLLLAATAGLAVAWLRTRRRLVAPVALAAALTALAFWAGHTAVISDPRAREVVSGLLHNVYHAFDFREEERIYDTLEKSVVGDLLQQTYLETRRGLELASQGGARAKVKAIEIETLEAEGTAGGAFTARATWNVSGSVGHWGHVHQRRNRYRSELTVTPVEGVWKLSDLAILEEERL